MNAKPVRAGWFWERLLLCMAALGTLAGYALVAGSYFIAPSRWTLPLEVVIYRVPGIEYGKLAGGVILGVVWMAGCLLLCRRAWKQSAVPGWGLSLAALTPLLVMSLNALFHEAMRRYPPFCLHW